MREHRARRWVLGVAPAVARPAATTAPTPARIVGDGTAWWGVFEDPVLHVSRTKEQRALAADNASAGRGLWRKG